MIRTDVSAKDPITFQSVTPALNVSTGLSVKEAGQTLSVVGTISGDSFPSTEAFVADAAGNKVFLGAFAANGGLGGVPGVLSLYGDNQNTLISINATINLDKNGNFVNVQQGDRTLSIREFNELFTSQNSGQ